MFENIKRIITEYPVECGLIVFTIFNIYLLSPILAEGYLHGGDNTSNFVYTLRVSEMIKAGNFRFWMSDYSLGQPLFFYYQPIPHLFTALIYLVFPFVEPLLIYKIMVLLLLTCLPLSVYKAMRWMGFEKSMCLIGAIITCSVGSWRGFGFELHTIFKWGQYAHTWGLVFTPLVIGYSYKSFYEEKRKLLPAVFLGVLFLIHGVMGIIASISIASLFLINDWNKKQKTRDFWYLLKIFLAVFCIAAFIIIPNLMYEDYVDGFSTADADKHFGIGLMKAISKFFKGELFDQSNIPIITVCVFISLIITSFTYFINNRLKTKDKEQKRIAFMGLNLLIATVLISGAQTFPFLKHTPVYNNLLVLRLLPYLHFVGILVASFGIGKLLNYARSIYKNPMVEIQFLKFSISFMLVFGLCYFGQRQQKLYKNKAKVTDHIRENGKANPLYREAFNFLKELPHGRLHIAGIKSHLQKHLAPALADKPISKFFAASSHTNLGLFYLKNMEDLDSTHYELFGLPYLITKSNGKMDSIGTSLFKNKGYEIKRTSATNSYFDVVHSNTVCLSHNQAARNLMLSCMNTSKLVRNKEHIVLAEDKTRDYFEGLGFSKFIEFSDKNQRIAASNCTIENIDSKESMETEIDENIGEYLAQGFDEGESKSFGTIEDEYHEDGYYKATVDVTSTTTDSLIWLTLKINAHADWKAKVDGKEVDWVQMNPCFMAVQVSPGRHTVEFEFVTSPMRKGLLVLCFSTIVILGLIHFKRT